MNDAERIAQLEAALAAAQWGSCDRCGDMRYCAICFAEASTYDDEKYESIPGKHEPDCIIGRALAGTR